MASFIIGFLGTAGPRITGAAHFSRAEVLTLVTLDLFAAGLHFGGSHRAADFFFALSLVTFAFILGKRFVRRVDSPPPNFALVALGFSKRCNWRGAPRILSKRTLRRALPNRGESARARLCPVADSRRRPLSPRASSQHLARGCVVGIARAATRMDAARGVCPNDWANDRCDIRS